MKKYLNDTPRNFSILSALIILNSHLYSLGGWLATGIGSGICWFGVISEPGNWMFLIFGGIFLLVGLTSLANSYRLGIETLGPMRTGSVSYGRLLSAKDESAQLSRFTAKAFKVSEEEMEDFYEAHAQKRKKKEPQNVIMDYIFEFEPKFGGKQRVKAKIKYLERGQIEDEPEELVLYHELQPHKAVVYDAIRNAPPILSNGEFGATPASKATILILPVLVILMNIVLFQFHFGPGEIG